MHDWRRLGPCSDTTLPYWEVARGSEKEPSFQQVVDLGPHLGRIVVVWPIDLPPSAGLPLSLRGAPVEHGAMCRRQSRVRSAMNRHRHLPPLSQTLFPRDAQRGVTGSQSA